MAMIESDGAYCKSCGLCINTCPLGLISWSDEAGETGFYPEQHNNEKCTGCKLCALICPDAAISVYK